jgi:hypothetical protein
MAANRLVFLMYIEKTGSIFNNSKPVFQAGKCHCVILFLLLPRHQPRPRRNRNLLFCTSMDRVSTDDPGLYNEWLKELIEALQIHEGAIHRSRLLHSIGMAVRPFLFRKLSL